VVLRTARGSACANASRSRVVQAPDTLRLLRTDKAAKAMRHQCQYKGCASCRRALNWASACRICMCTAGDQSPMRSVSSEPD
jgi:hypothetical protein